MPEPDEAKVSSPVLKGGREPKGSPPTRSPMSVLAGKCWRNFFMLKGRAMIKKMIYTVVLCILPILFSCAFPLLTSSPVNEPKLVIVKGSFNTTANNGPGGQVINIDAVSRTAFPFAKIKRYTLTINTALLSTAPVGIDRIEVHVGVLDGAASYDFRVIQQDPATAAPFPHPGMTVLPYIGSNSYIKVFRGADGLGTVEVRFNAYVEVEP